MNANVEMTVTECPECGMSFAVTKRFEARRRNDHMTFCCPQGHPQSYQGETKEEKLRQNLKVAKENLQWHREVKNNLYEREDYANRRIAALKGHITRLKNRAAN